MPLVKCRTRTDASLFPPLGDEAERTATPPTNIRCASSIHLNPFRIAFTEMSTEGTLKRSASAAAADEHSVEASSSQTALANGTRNAATMTAQAQDAPGLHLDVQAVKAELVSRQGYTSGFSSQPAGFSIHD